MLAAQRGEAGQCAMPSKTTFIGGGGSLTTIAIGLYASGWPEQVRAHPLGIATIGIAGVIFMACGLFRTPSKEQPIGNKTQTAGDVSGKMFQADTLNYYEAAPVKPPPLSQPAKPSLPVLELQFPQPALVEVFDTMVDFSESGQKSHLISVHNKAAVAGEEAFSARSISAGVTFTPFGSSRTTFVDSACWIGKIENEISLPPSGTAYLLIGTSNENEWITYTNPNKYNSGGWPSRNENLNEVKFPLYASAKFAGEITIVAHQSNKATTLIVRKFIITVDETRFSLNIRWQDQA
jgi:hypothetical protein